MWRTVREHPLMAAFGLLVVLAAFLLVAPLLAGTPQKVNMSVAKGMLAAAYRTYTNTGSLTMFGGDVWLSSNTVTVGGIRYQCFLQTRHPGFSGRGTLAMTTNFTFIWLDTNGMSKIIPTNYSPPLIGY